MEAILSLIAGGILFFVFWTFVFVIDDLFLGGAIMDMFTWIIDKIIDILTYLVKEK